MGSSPSVMDKGPPRWSLGYVAPRLIVLAALVDLSLRLVPSGWIGFDGLAEYAYRLPGDAFARNYHLRGQHSGNLASLANLPERRIYRSVSTTTDALGFRNAGPTVDIAGVVVGDSFANDAVSSNDEQLSSQVGRYTGCRLYNAGAASQPEIQQPSGARVMELARYLGMASGLVVVERVEQIERLGAHEFRKPTEERPVFGRAPGALERARVWASVSPARILAEGALKPLFNDILLPNVYRRAAIEKTLTNGDWMLFFEDEMSGYRTQRPVSIEYWKYLQSEVRPASLGVLVVLVPNKYTVYYRHLVDAEPFKPAPEDYLNATESALRAAGIPVVNLTAPLQREASAALRKNEYLYHRDDTHWNRAGIAVAAREIAQVWTQAGGRQCP
jgi:hypothetical protein